MESSLEHCKSELPLRHPSRDSCMYGSGREHVIALHHLTSRLRRQNYPQIVIKAMEVEEAALRGFYCFIF